jgi:hypothetical protein
VIARIVDIGGRIHQKKHNDISQRKSKFYLGKAQ